MKSPTARIDGILAREANVAVVFRRGPTRRTQCLRWDLATDEVIPGQWIDGRVYPQHCDLSPDGELLVGAYALYGSSGYEYQRSQGEPDLSNWTAVSRPPYLTPLVFWRSQGTYFHGGLWSGRRELERDLAFYAMIDEATVPKEIIVRRHRGEESGSERFGERLKLGGWREVRGSDLSALVNETLASSFATSGEPERTSLMEKPFAEGRLVRTRTPTRETWSAFDSDDRVRLHFDAPIHIFQWLDIDHHHRVIYGDRGCLWAWAGFPDGESKLVADLNANRFEPVEAPAWAREWPSE